MQEKAQSQLLRRSRIEPPGGIDPAIARFIEELACAAVRRENRRRADDPKDCASENCGAGGNA